MGIQLMILSALCAALSNLALRRSIDKGGTSQVYLVIQLAITALFAILLNPVRTGNYAWSTSMAIFGLVGGAILGLFMSTFGKALENGPPGLTIAMLNCSTVMPIFLMLLFFGSSFGFTYTAWNAVGSLLVITGLCWAGWQSSSHVDRKRWLLFVTLAFSFHIIYLVFLQWRVLLINFPGKEGLGLNLAAEEAASQWFMPLVFFAAAVMQTYLLLRTQRRAPNRGELYYGVIGGITNGACAFFMIKSTEVASSFELAMIFPIFSVALILACNLWGRWLYKEQIHWKGNVTSIAGLVLGTVNWAAVLG